MYQYFFIASLKHRDDHFSIKISASLMKYLLEMCDNPQYIAHILSTSENEWGSRFN